VCTSDESTALGVGQRGLRRYGVEFSVPRSIQVWGWGWKWVVGCRRAGWGAASGVVGGRGTFGGGCNAAAERDRETHGSRGSSWGAYSGRTSLGQERAGVGREQRVTNCHAGVQVSGGGRAAGIRRRRRQTASHSQSQRKSELPRSIGLRVTGGGANGLPAARVHPEEEYKNGKRESCTICVAGIRARRTTNSSQPDQVTQKWGWGVWLGGGGGVGGVLGWWGG